MPLGGIGDHLSASDLDSAHGGAKGPNAVVDIEGRIRGFNGLRVIDAPIWPDVPSIATAFPTMMFAERIATSMA